MATQKGHIIVSVDLFGEEDGVRLVFALQKVLLLIGIGGDTEDRQNPNNGEIGCIGTHDTFRFCASSYDIAQAILESQLRIFLRLLLFSSKNAK